MLFDCFVMFLNEVSSFGLNSKRIPSSSAPVNMIIEEAARGLSLHAKGASSLK